MPCGAASTNHTRQPHRWREMCVCRVDYHRGFSSYAVCEFMLFLRLCLVVFVSTSRASFIHVLVLVFMPVTALLARSASDRQMMTTLMKSDAEYCIKIQQHFAIARLVLSELQPERGHGCYDPKFRTCVVLRSQRFVRNVWKVPTRSAGATFPVRDTSYRDEL